MSEQKSEVIDPWDLLATSGKRVRLGQIGVDSGTIKVGDFCMVQVRTLTGDGCYPVLAQCINGRRCIVIEMEAQAYGTPMYYQVPARCPHCNGIGDDDSFWDNRGHKYEATCEDCGKKYMCDYTEITDWIDP